MKIRCCPSVQLGERRGWSRRIFVQDAQGQNVPAYELMCQAIDNDIQTAEGSGAATLKALALVEKGESEKEELGGNAWYTYINQDKVWFEGQYSQGEGGEVSFAQYKLAVQTYVRFLADPEHRPIEVPFPDGA